MALIPLRLNGREVAPRKAIMSATFGAKTVLTNSPWTFVVLWLKRNKKRDALFYWEQAQQFWQASIGLPIQSAPLLLYYSYMNAAKALLSRDAFEAAMREFSIAPQMLEDSQIADKSAARTRRFAEARAA